MKFTNNLDLTVIENQNDIALLLSYILPLSLLEELFSKRENLIEINKRDINIESKNILEVNYEDINILLLDLVDIKSFPINRAVYLRISFGNKYQFDIKMKYTDNIKQYIVIILAKSINYSNYKSINDNKYIKAHIIQNFAKEISYISKDSLKTIKNIIYIIDNKNNESDIKNINKYFKLEDIEMYIYTEPEFLKIEFTGTKSNSLFLINNRLVFQSIIIIIETALYIKSNKFYI